VGIQSGSQWGNHPFSETKKRQFAMAKARRREAATEKWQRRSRRRAATADRDGTERAVQLGRGLKVGEAPDRHHKYI
jgi:hypothetical protein